MGKTTTESVSADAKTAAIRADIERTRGDMSNTVNEIEERLSPAHIKEQIADVKQAAIGQYHDAKDHVKADLSNEIAEAKLRVQEEVQHAKRMLQDEMRHAKRAVHDATVGKVQHMARDARSSFMDTVRENPIPSAMVAIGLGWLLMGGGKSERRDERVRVRGYDDYDYDFSGGTDDDESLGHRVRRGARGALDSVQGGASRAVEKGQEALHDAGDAASSIAHRAGEGIEHLAHDARSTTRRAARGAGRTMRRAEAGIETTLRENPLAVGAVALAVGAAVGLALPHTDKEDQLMGAAKDRLVERARGVAHDALQTANTKVDEIARTAEEQTSKLMPRESNPNFS